MAQVLPAFYDSFTRGRKDAIDFQNLITAQKENAQMFPHKLRMTEGYADSITETARGQRRNNDVRAPHLTQEQANYGAGLGVDADKLRTEAGYYQYGLGEANRLAPESRYGHYAGMLNPSAVGNRYINPSGELYPDPKLEQNPFGGSNPALLYNYNPDAFGPQGTQQTAPPETAASTGYTNGKLGPDTPFPDPERFYGVQSNADPTNLTDKYGLSANTGVPGMSTSQQTPVIQGTQQQQLMAKLAARGVTSQQLQQMFELDKRLGLWPGYTLSTFGVESGYGQNLIGQKTPYGQALGPFQITDNNVATFSQRANRQFDPMKWDDALAMYTMLMEENRGKVDPNADYADEMARLYYGGADRNKWGDNTVAYPIKIREQLQQFIGQ